MSEKKRATLNLVQRTELYLMLKNLHESGQLKNMTFDDIQTKVNGGLPFKVTYGQIKSIIYEAEFDYARRTTASGGFGKITTAIKDEIKSVRDSAMDNAASLGVLQSQFQGVKEECSQAISLINLMDEQVKEVYNRVSEKSFENFKDMLEAKFQTILDTLRHFEKRITDLERRAGMTAIPSRLPPKL